MVQLAKQLNAVVIGDDGERYDLVVDEAGGEKLVTIE
jgi:hypothetical protein